MTEDEITLLAAQATIQAHNLSELLESLAEQTELSRRYAYEVQDITFRLAVGWAQRSGHSHLTSTDERIEALHVWMDEQEGG